MCLPRIDDKICLSGPFVSRSLLYLPSFSFPATFLPFLPPLLVLPPPPPPLLASNLSTLTKQLCAKELQIPGRKKSRGTMLLRFQLILIHQKGTGTRAKTDDTDFFFLNMAVCAVLSKLKISPFFL